MSKKIFFVLYVTIIIMSSCETTKYVTTEKDLSFIDFPTVFFVTDNTLNIQFKTSLPVKYKISYWTAGTADSIASETFQQSHNISLVNLYPGLTYHFYIKMTEFHDDLVLHSDTLTSTTSENELSDGWESYSNGNYSEALNSFSAYADTGRYKLLATNAIAWCYLKTGDTSQATSLFEHNYGLVNDDPLNKLGLMVLNQIKGEHRAAIPYGLSILNHSENWQFDYYKSYNSDVVKILLAESYLLIDDMEEAINYLNSFFAEELEADNPQTWRINETKYNSLEEFIVAAINYLKSDY